MPRTYDLLAPSLHPNTILDISFPEPGPSSPDPIVRHLAIKHASHAPIGRAKRMLLDHSGNLVIADDAFQISTLTLGTKGAPVPPEVISQEKVQSRKGDVWAGLVTVRQGVISALTSGHLTLHSHTSPEAPPLERDVPSPLTSLASSSISSTTFALAGKEVDVSAWDVERTFSPPSDPRRTTEKRKKGALESGEIWRARNLPNNSLALRVPIHHLCLAHLPNSENMLVSGTKSGSVRRYDTRQRKPCSDWKVAREGGIGCVVPGVEHELFFADRSSLVGALDLRTGRLLYSYPSITCTAHHLLPIPSPASGLATISSDATLRLHSTVPPRAEGMKGNAGGEGRKPKVLGMVGGVGVGNAVWRGFGEMPDELGERGVVFSGEEEGGEMGDEEVWEEMSEVEDLGSSEEEDEGDIPPKRSRK